MSKLENCPFCNSDLIGVSGGMGSHPFSVKCARCLMEGPPERTREQAIAAWNRRYVCDDKNGKAVYADSHFRIWGKDILCFVWDSEFLRWGTRWVDGKLAGQSCDAMFANYEIELIEVKDE